MPYMVPDPTIFARLQSIFWVVVGMWNVDGRFPEELEIDEWIFLKEATNMYIFERVFPFVVFVCFSFCNICSSWCLLDIGIFGNHWKQTSRSKARLCMSYEVLIMLERVYFCTENAL